MEIEITVRMGDREVRFSQVVEGTAQQREEASHQLGKAVGRVVAEAALNDQAAHMQRPHCCGLPCSNTIAARSG